MRAWLHQDTRQKRKLGAKAPWSVGWIDPDGNRRSKAVGLKSMAEKYRRKLEGELAAGIFRGENRTTWEAFRERFERDVVSGMKPGTARVTLQALDHFERLARPKLMKAVTSATIAAYVARRRLEPGREPGATISAATVNKDLRHVKAALVLAHEWKMLAEVPKFRMLKELEKIPTYVTAEHFGLIYRACDVATRPAGQAYTAAAWWRGLVTFAYMTGWRIGEILSLRWDDVSLDHGTAKTLAESNKGGRDDLAPLHPVVVDHLRKVWDYGLLVFPWPHSEATLWREHQRIQEAAGLEVRYGFHDYRRGFATCNAESMTPNALQRLMRHKSPQTTARYINLAGQVNRAVENLVVPEVLREKTPCV